MGPKFKVGDRVFSHYTMKWGTITKVGETEVVKRQGEPTGHFDTWHEVRWDDGKTDIMNDGGSMGWEMARVFPPAIAERYGYGKDPRVAQPHTLAD